MNESPARDHNQPPELLPIEALVADIKERYFDLLKRMRDVKSSLDAAPASIDDDATAQLTADLLKAAKKARSASEQARKVEGEPFATRKTAVDALFKNPADSLKDAEKPVVKALGEYQAVVADAKRRKAEAAAEAARAEEERLRKEAEEAEARKREAEAARMEEQRKAAEAQLEKARAEAAAKAEAERAATARAEVERLEREAEEARIREVERQRREAEEAEARKAKQEEDRLAEIAREREAAARREREAEEAAQRQKDLDEMKARAAEAAEKARAEREAAEKAAKAARADEREAKAAEKSAASQAKREAKAAEKDEKIAGGTAANLSRQRSDFGAVATVATRWTIKVIDYDALPRDLLWPHINRDAIDAAANKFLQTLTAADKADARISGLKIEEVEETRIL